MRRRIRTAITLVAAIAGAGCEDGPSQTFSTAPPGVGSLWNGPPAGAIIPDSGTVVGSAKRGFDATTGGSNADTLLGPSEEEGGLGGQFLDAHLAAGSGGE